MPFQVHTIKAGMAYCHLVENDGGVILIDTGAPGNADRIINWVRSFDKPLRLIFITHAHFDHYGCAAAVRRATNAPVAIHSEDAETMARGETPLGAVRLYGHISKLILPILERLNGPEPLEADIVFDESVDMSEYGIDAQVLHTPGHTPGSVALVVEERTAFVGDLVSPMLFPHAQLVYAIDWDELGNSLRKMQQIELDRVYCGHAPEPMSGETFRTLKPYWTSS